MFVPYQDDISYTLDINVEIMTFPVVMVVWIPRKARMIVLGLLLCQIHVFDSSFCRCHGDVWSRSWPLPHSISYS